MGIIFPIMRTQEKSHAHRICRLVLRPLASMFLRCGLTWKEFSDLSKSVFVQSATEEFGISGRPTNISRVSILTGISRKEVKRQRDLVLDREPVTKGKTTDATRVLSGWYQNPAYQDSDSSPLLLAESGPRPSFDSLCSTYSGDISPHAMLKELLKTQAVVRTDDGLLRVVKRYYQPAVHDDENLLWAVSLIRDLTETMNNNVFLTDEYGARFGRKADNDRVPVSAVSEFREFLDQKGQTFLEEIDDWLTEHETSESAEPSEYLRIGVGMFAIENKNTEENTI